MEDLELSLGENKIYSYKFINRLPGLDEHPAYQTNQLVNLYLSDKAQQYTLFQNGCHLGILLFLFKLDLDASFKAKYSFEFSAQERGIKG